MKVFNLVCTTFNGELACAQTFLSEDEACKKLQEDFDKSKEYASEYYDEIASHCANDYAFIDTDNEETSYKWSIVPYNITASPSDILDSLRQSMWYDVELRAEAIVPGYSSARKAVIDLRGEQFHKLSFTNGAKLLKVEAFIGMIGLAVVVMGPDGVTRNAVVGFDNMGADEILELHTIVTNIKHPTRAINPFWFVDDRWHDTLIGILNKTEEEYQKFISNNPKNH